MQRCLCDIVDAANSCFPRWWESDIRVRVLKSLAWRRRLDATTCVAGLETVLRLRLHGVDVSL